ncbi:MAG: nucleotidyltransferase family protein, partial [Sphingorhabdus sp.]
PNPSSKGDGLYTLSPSDMAIHCAAHLIADGDLAGGLRNLWDFHCLLTEFSATDRDYFVKLQTRAAHHQLWPAVHRAVRMAHELYGTEIPKEWQGWNRQDKWYVRRLTARDGWGRPRRKITRQIFYIRSHWLRMPPVMLARHLFTKWRKAKDKK